MDELGESTLRRIEDSLRKLAGSRGLRFRKTDSPHLFCSTLPSHWRSNKSLQSPFVLLALQPIPDGTKVSVHAGNEENNTADLKNNHAEFASGIARFSDLRFVGKSGRGKSFNLTITIFTQPAYQIVTVPNAIKVTVDGPRDSRNPAKQLNGQLPRNTPLPSAPHRRNLPVNSLHGVRPIGTKALHGTSLANPAAAGIPLAAMEHMKANSNRGARPALAHFLLGSAAPFTNGPSLNFYNYNTIGANWLAQLARTPHLAANKTPIAACALPSGHQASTPLLNEVFRLMASIVAPPSTSTSHAKEAKRGIFAAPSRSPASRTTTVSSTAVTTSSSSLSSGKPSASSDCSPTSISDLSSPYSNNSLSPSGAAKRRQSDILKGEMAERKRLKLESNPLWRPYDSS